MSVLLYIDHHVKAAIVDGLRLRGVDVITCAEDGTERADDSEILERAKTLGRAVFTQDDDFLSLASEWIRKKKDFSGVLNAHQLRITIGQAIDDLELIAKVLDSLEIQNRILFLPFQ
jgi:predicted nuclease of predicted toxin-antitoxin system